MEPEEPRSRLEKCIDSVLDRAESATRKVVMTMVAVTFYSQTALAQEGIEAALGEWCVERVASLLSLAYYSVAAYLVLKGFFLIESPKDQDQSRKEERSDRMRGVIFIGIGAVAGVFPVIAAAAGIVDVTGCIAAGNIGSD